MRAFIPALASILLVACEVRPPPEFLAVPSQHAADRAVDFQGNARDCPDLSGSFEAPREILRELFGDFATQKMATSRVSFVRDPRRNGEFAGAWHVTRDAFLDKLAQAHAADPRSYEKSREKLLRADSGADVKTRPPYPLALLALGESYATSIRTGQSCEDHWTQLSYGINKATGQTFKLYLGRNQEGSLLLKRVTYNNTLIPLGSITTSVDSVLRLKARRVDDDLQPFSDAELLESSTKSSSALPPALAPAAPICTAVLAQLTKFDQRVRTLLPKGAEISAFHADHASLDRTYCAFIKVDIGVSAPTAADLSALPNRLLRERLVRDFELLDRREQAPGTSGTLRVTVNLLHTN
jgi:hypothetical protein